MESIGTFLPLIAMMPFVGALFPGLMIQAGRNVCAVTAAIPTMLAITMLAICAPAVLDGAVLHFSLPWLPSLGLNVNFFLDGLGLLFAGLHLAGCGFAGCGNLPLRPFLVGVEFIGLVEHVLMFLDC